MVRLGLRYSSSHLYNPELYYVIISGLSQDCSKARIAMTMMTGKEALMKILRNESVEYVFGLSRFTEVLFMDALEKQQDCTTPLWLDE